jgi:type IV pilus assembly protein PilA
MAICPQCGNAVDPNARFCAVCGRDLMGPPVQTVYQPTAASTPYAAPLASPQTSGKAIASLILGIFFLFIPTAILAIIFGHLSLSDIKKSAGRLQGRGMAITGLVLGYAGLAFIPVILIIAAIAIPNLLRARIAANETSAVRAVRDIVTAEITYQTSNPDVGYTCRLQSLGGASDSCTPSPDRACLINDELASGRRHGYSFELLNCTAEQAGGPMVRYQVVAYPENKNATGRRVFCSDETGVIRFDKSGSAEQCLASGPPLE